jgi:N utilization substance protein A
VYIAKALSPARVSGVYLNEHGKGAKTATVVVPEDQLSLAIGRDGQNARLAAKLTSWRIDIKSLPEAATDALDKLRNDPQYAMMLPKENDVIPQVEAVLAKKSEGRPVTPEEYQVLNQFVDRVERGLLRQLQAEKQAEEERQRVAEAQIPAQLFGVPIEKFEISDRVFAVISAAGFQSVGDLMLQFRTKPDSILKLAGMGPKAMKELEEALERASAAATAQAEAAAELEAELALEAEAEAAPVEAPVAEEPDAAELVEAAEAPAVPVVDEAAVAEAPVAEPAVGELVTAEQAGEPVAPEAAAGAESAEPGVPEEQEALEQIFALRPEVLDVEGVEEDEDEDDKKKKKKKGKKKFVEMEYDPDAEVMVVKKKRKRAGDEWGF